MSFMFLFGSFLGALNSDFGLCFILVTLSLCPVLSIFTIVHLSFVRWWRRSSCRLCRTGVLSMWRSTQLGRPCHVITPRISANGLHPQRELHGGTPSKFDKLNSKTFSCDCVKTISCVERKKNFWLLCRCPWCLIWGRQPVVASWCSWSATKKFWWSWGGWSRRWRASLCLRHHPPQRVWGPQLCQAQGGLG